MEIFAVGTTKTNSSEMITHTMSATWTAWYTMPHSISERTAKRRPSAWPIRFFRSWHAVQASSTTMGETSASRPNGIIMLRDTFSNEKDVAKRYDSTRPRFSGMAHQAARSLLRTCVAKITLTRIHSDKRVNTATPPTTATSKVVQSTPTTVPRRSSIIASATRKLFPTLFLIAVCTYSQFVS